MALPTPSELDGLSFSKNGTPWHRVASKSDQDADGLSFSKDGTPFWFIESGTPPAGSVIKINIGDTFKDYNSMKINIGDVWKDVISVKINIGDTWKDAF